MSVSPSLSPRWLGGENPDTMCACGHPAYLHVRGEGEPGDCLYGNGGRFGCGCETFTPEVAGQVLGFAITLYVSVPSMPIARDLGDLLKAAIEQARRTGNEIVAEVTVDRVSVVQAPGLLAERDEAVQASEARRARRRGEAA